MFMYDLSIILADSAGKEHHAPVEQSERMKAVQSPVIPIVAEWIRARPGTISLGQGVVNYGPPKGALEAIGNAITRRTRAVVSISPNNPMGAVYAEPVLRQMNDLCRDSGIYHIHDEAYEHFVWDGAKHYSPGSADGAWPHTISLFSLSKSYGFASWRIGYMVIPEHLFEAVRKIQDTILICPPVISQFAAIGAMKEPAYCREKLKGIGEVRAMVAEELKEISRFCTIAPAAGAFYFFMKVHTHLDSMTMVERLIR